jgi:hypothetical protein
MEALAGGPGKVVRLPKALYGFRQAPRAWNKKLEQELKGLGFSESNADPALWILRGEQGAVMAMFYVDDGFVAARTSAEADAIVSLIGSLFEIKVLREPQDFLGIEIVRDRAAGTIIISQEVKALSLAERLGVAGSRRSVLMLPEVYSELRATRTGEPVADRAQYQQVLGSLLHMVQCTRPDIALPVGAFAAYAAAPSERHFAALLVVVRYVGATAGRGIVLRISH